MASKHLEDGDFSLARGLSDSIVREVRKERDAMGDVQRALRQKKKIKQRWKGHDDASLWDDYYNPGTETPGVAEVNIVKNRSGQTGKVDLFFSKEFTQFSNYAKQDQQ